MHSAGCNCTLGASTSGRSQVSFCQPKAPGRKQIVTVPAETAYSYLAKALHKQAGCRSIGKVAPALASGGGGRSTVAETHTQGAAASLQGLQLPKHIGLICDGNARWAAARGQPTEAGHSAGAQTLAQLVTACREYGIQALTVFAFSAENWGRPKAEVDFLMMLFSGFLDDRVVELYNLGIRVMFIGQRDRLPTSLLERMQSAEAMTASNSKMLLTIAISYSATQDLAQAARTLASQVQQGLLDASDINEALLESRLSTSFVTECVGPVDLLIRTSGEQRTSNFLAWEAAWAELVFDRRLFPDFNRQALIEAIQEFSRRQRRFGKRVSEQPQHHSQNGKHTHSNVLPPHILTHSSS